MMKVTNVFFLGGEGGGVGAWEVCLGAIANPNRGAITVHSRRMPVT